MTWDELVDDVTAAHPDLKPGQMFGMPCLKRSQRVVVPPAQSDECEALAMDALRDSHAPRWENQDPASSSR